MDSKCFCSITLYVYHILWTKQLLICTAAKHGSLRITYVLIILLFTKYSLSLSIYLSISLYLSLSFSCQAMLLPFPCPYFLIFTTYNYNLYCIVTYGSTLFDWELNCINFSDIYSFFSKFYQFDYDKHFFSAIKRSSLQKSVKLF